MDASFSCHFFPPLFFPLLFVLVDKGLGLLPAVNWSTGEWEEDKTLSMLSRRRGDSCALFHPFIWLDSFIYSFFAFHSWKNHCFALLVILVSKKKRETGKHNHKKI